VGSKESPDRVVGIVTVDDTLRQIEGNFGNSNFQVRKQSFDIDI
jgi:hypothetical protein